MNEYPLLSAEVKNSVKCTILLKKLPSSILRNHLTKKLSQNCDFEIVNWPLFWETIPRASPKVGSQWRYKSMAKLVLMSRKMWSLISRVSQRGITQ